MLKFVEGQRVLGHVILELLMDLILGSCWIWVKLVVDKTLQEVCCLEGLWGFKRCHVLSRRPVWKLEAKN